MSKENMIKVVITQLGEQKLSKIIDLIGDDEDGKTNEFIPICGKSFLLTEKTGKSLIAKKYGKKCATPEKKTPKK